MVTSNSEHGGDGWMQTIIFDFGNVVGFFDHELTLKRLAPFTDMQPEEMFDAVYGGGLEDAFEEGKISATDFLEESRKLCRLRCDIDFMAGAFADSFRPNPQGCSVIPLLKGRYRILLGSNTNELHSNQFLKQFADVLGHFNDLVLSCRINLRKPHAGFFEHCRLLPHCHGPGCWCVHVPP